MTHFIIDSKDFKNFLSSIHLDGLVFDCLIKVEKKKLLVSGLDIANAIYFSLECKAQVKKMGKLAVPNIKDFSKILDRFDGEIEVSVEKKQVKIKQKRKIARFDTVKEKTIDSFTKADVINVKGQTIKSPKINGNLDSNYITIGADQLHEVVKDASTLDEHVYSFNLKKDGIVIKVQKDTSSFSNKIKPEELKIKKEMSIDLGHGAREIFGALTGSVKMFFGPKLNVVLVRYGKKFRNVYLITKRG